MKHFEEISEFDQDFQSMNQKITISKNDQQEVLSSINTMIEQRPSKKTKSINWRYPVATVAVLFLLAIITLPIVNNFLVGNNLGLTQGSNPPVADPVDDGYLLKVLNNTDFEFDALEINVYHNGDYLKATQGSMYADGSPIQPGDTIEFDFTESEMNSGGKVSLQAVLIDEYDEEHLLEKGAAHSNGQRIPLELGDEKVIYLELIGESINKAYLSVKK